MRDNRSRLADDGYARLVSQTVRPTGIAAKGRNLRESSNPERRDQIPCKIRHLAVDGVTAEWLGIPRLSSRLYVDLPTVAPTAGARFAGRCDGSSAKAAMLDQRQRASQRPNKEKRRTDRLPPSQNCRETCGTATMRSRCFASTPRLLTIRSTRGRSVARIADAAERMLRS